MIISVDDHVVEPPNVWQDRLPSKYAEVGPRIVRAPMPEVEFRGGLAQGQARVEGRAGRLVVLRGPQAPAAAGRLRRRRAPRRGDHEGRHLRGHAAGLLRGEAPARRHGRQPHRGGAVLPDLPPLLRPDLHRGQGQGARPALRQGLQRLDGRRVVRRLGRPAHPALPHPAVGRRAGGGRGAAQRGARRARRVLQRDPAVPRPAERARPRPLLGPLLPGLRRDPDDREHAHRQSRRRCRRPRRTPRRRSGRR